jgi:DNA-binding transcriptional regulator YiaG
VSLDLRERPETDARPPAEHILPSQLYTPIRVPPVLYGVGLFASGGLEFSTSIGATTTGAYVMYCDAGTLSEPVRRLDVPKRTSAQDVLEVRFISGLTWGELGELFGVSRRAVHHWATGERMRTDNILLVQEMLRQVRRLRQESSAETRLALLTPTPLGRPLDLLKGSRWSDACAAMRLVLPIRLPSLPHPNPTQLHPAAYLGALTDRPVPPTGRAVPGRSRRIPRRSPR